MSFVLSTRYIRTIRISFAALAQKIGSFDKDIKIKEVDSANHTESL